jgi:hypothetical protein
LRVFATSNVTSTPLEVTVTLFWTNFAIVVVLAIVSALAEPSLARRRRRREERARLRAVVAVMHMFNGGHR